MRACLKVSGYEVILTGHGAASGQTSAQADPRLWSLALNLITEPDFYLHSTKFSDHRILEERMLILISSPYLSLTLDDDCFSLKH